MYLAMQPVRMTLRQLRVFTAVTRTGSATAAGLEIGLSQSAVSSALAELESILGTPLFDRVGKRLVANDIARSLQPRALALLEESAAFEQAARGELPRHALRIGASTTIGNYVLPPLLARFLGRHDEYRHEDHEQWASEVRIANTADICRAVAAFELDVGIVEGPSHEASLHALPWMRDEMVIVAAADDALASRREPVSPQALRQATWLLREPGSGTREVADAMLQPYLQHYLRVRVLASSGAIKRAAAEGLGLACLSRWVVQDLLDQGRLRRVRTDIPALHRQCYVVFHRTRQNTPHLAALLDLLGAQAGVPVEWTQARAALGELA